MSKKENNGVDIQKNKYLGEFKRNNSPENEGFRLEAEQVGKLIVSTIKREALTYDDAYAALQFAYKLLKYESNFVKVQ